MLYGSVSHNTTHFFQLGTKIAAFFRYTSQTALVQLTVFILIFFVYGNLEDFQKPKVNILIQAGKSWSKM